MADVISNRLPWAELVGCVSVSDATKARTAQRFFDNKRFANNKNHTKRGLIRRLVDVVFDCNLSLIDMAQRIADELRENSDAKALNACVEKIEELGREGWRRIDSSAVTLRCADLEVQLQPDALLTNDEGARLFLYTYFRQSPPLSTDAIRALLCLVRLTAGRDKPLQDPRIVVLDCYNDRSYEGADFREGEPWIAKQMERVLITYNSMYRIHLDGSPPPPSLGNPRKSIRRPRALGTDRTGFSISSSNNQLCLQFA